MDKDKEEEDENECKECSVGEDIEAEEEGIVHKEVRSPGQPSRSEVEKHELTHIPFRVWCEHCVRGRGKSAPHLKIEKDSDEGEIPKIEIDYCFQKKEDEAKNITTLVMKESPSGCIASIVAPHKGKEDYVIRRAIETIKLWGNQKIKIIIRNDGEASIKALAKMIQQRRELERSIDTEDSNAGTIVEETPLNESASLGGAEKAVQEVEGHVRTWLSHIEKKMKCEVNGNSPVIAWLIEHVSVAINRTKVGVDGKTAYARIKGKNSKIKLLPFGEKVLWMIPKEERRKGPKMRPRFNHGIWVGINEHTGEYIVMTPDGIKRTRTIRRIPEADRWDQAFMKGCKGTPWDTAGADMPEDMSDEVRAPESNTQEKTPQPEEAKLKRMRIYPKDVDEIGPTKGCGGCRAVILKMRSQTHSEACRKRMTEKLSETERGAERVQYEEEKLTRSLAEVLKKRVEEGDQDAKRQKTQGKEEESKAAELFGDFSDEESEERNKRSKEDDDQEAGPGNKRQRINAIMYLHNEGKKRDDIEVWNRIIKENPVMIVGIANDLSAEDAEFYSDVYKFQIDKGRYFTHEESQERKFQQNDCAVKVLMEPKIHQVASNLKDIGVKVMTSKGPRKVEGNINVITNSSKVAEAFERYPDKIVEYETNKEPDDIQTQKLIKSDISRLIERSQAIKDIIGEKTKEQLSEDRKKHEGLILAFEASQEDGETESDSIGSQEFYDHVNGGKLDAKKVKEARLEEIRYFKKMRVYEKVSKRMCRQSKQRSPIGVRWIDTCKGDGTYRSRLVAKEFNKSVRPEFFSATPPIESFKLLMSMAVTAQNDKTDWQADIPVEQRFRNGKGNYEEICVLYSDISRAYFHAPAREEKYVDIPNEDWETGDEEMCGKLRVSMYGTRDAAANWEACYAEVLTNNGFTKGRASPCLYFHEGRKLRLSVHGDDFVGVGSLGHIRWIMEILDNSFEAKHKVMGNDEHLLKELRILNRTVKWNPTGLTIEPDSKHVRVLLEEMNMNEAKPLSTPAVRAPGAKNSKDEGDDEDDLAEISEDKIRGNEEGDEGDKDEELDSEGGSKYRSWTARLNYLGIDRSDIQFAVKECAKCMARPRKTDLVKLKRIARYLRSKPELVTVYERQRNENKIKAYTDSDWAGDRCTRKSTSGGALMVGAHSIKTWSKDQSVVALSSGEAELYAANYGGAQALGLKSMMKDLGVTAKIDLLIDAKATMGIISRQGLGKVRHIEVQDLWLQGAIKDKRMKLSKVPGEENMADLMTKPLAAEVIRKHLSGLRMS